jgi:hypothetical protein
MKNGKQAQTNGQEDETLASGEIKQARTCLGGPEDEPERDTAPEAEVVAPRSSAQVRKEEKNDGQG